MRRGEIHATSKKAIIVLVSRTQYMRMAYETSSDVTRYAFTMIVGNVHTAHDSDTVYTVFIVVTSSSYRYAQARPEISRSDLH